jgi:hypothetical protein
MNGRQHEQWLEDNQAALSAEFDWLQALLENSGDENASPAVAEPPESTAPTLDYLSAQFGLSSFERSIVLLCAGAELNSALLSLCGAEGPTFGMALAALPDAHWNALSPASPLRHWQLVRAGGHGRITTARLSLGSQAAAYRRPSNCRWTGWSACGKAAKHRRSY